MFDDPITQWSFTLVFLVLGLDSAVRMIGDRSRPLQAIGHGLHVVMSADMVAMSWPWWSDLPGTPQIVFFAIAAGWFAVMLLGPRLFGAARWPEGGHHPWHQVTHAVMMLAMVWMVVSMAGMDTSASGHNHSAMPVLIAVSGVVLVGGLIVSAMVFIADFVEILREKGHRGEHARAIGAHALMNVGMAAMCLPMLVG